MFKGMVAGIGNVLPVAVCADVLLDLGMLLGELSVVVGLLDGLGCHDQSALCINAGLTVVTGDSTGTVDFLHVQCLGIGDVDPVSVTLLPRHTRLPFVELPLPFLIFRLEPTHLVQALLSLLQAAGLAIGKPAVCQVFRVVRTDLGKKLVQSLPIHALIPAGVGLDPGAVDADRLELRQTLFLCDPHDLDKQIRKKAKVALTEPAQAGVVRAQVAGNKDEMHVTAALLLKLAAAAHTYAVSEKPGGQHHPGIALETAAKAKSGFA